jgi:HK97 family phage major capsid protein
MLTKEGVEKMLEEAKETKARVEAAETKVKEVEAQTMKALTSNAAYGTRSDSEENRAMRAFGVTTPKALLGLNTADAKFNGVSAELKHAVRQLKEAVDTGRKIAQMFHGESVDVGTFSDGTENHTKVRGILDTYYGKNVLAPTLKAFGTNDQGADWIQTAVSQVYIPEFELEYTLEDKFKSINMPTNPYIMPVSSGVTKARKAAEGATLTASNFNAGKLTMNAVKIGEFFLMPEEISEDSAPDILSLAKSELVMAQKRAVEAALISGDSDGTHIDSDIQALGSDVAEKFWPGLRQMALANSGATVNFNGPVTESGLLAMRSKMKKFGVNPKDLLWIVGPSVHAQMLGLTSVMTVDKFGPQAQILNGALSAIFGAPIYVAGALREDLNATGVYDGVTQTKGSVLLVNHRRFYVGIRRPVEVRLQMALPNQDQFMLASYQRKAFKGHVQSAQEMSVVYGYNASI